MFKPIKTKKDFNSLKSFAVYVIRPVLKPGTYCLEGLWPYLSIPETLACSGFIFSKELKLLIFTQC
jgi:hypothetical protein